MYKIQRSSELCDSFCYEPRTTLLFLRRQCHLVAAGGGWIRTWLCSQRPWPQSPQPSRKSCWFHVRTESPQRGSCEPDMSSYLPPRLSPYIESQYNCLLFLLYEEKKKKKNRNKSVHCCELKNPQRLNMAECQSPNFPEQMLRRRLRKPVCGLALYT